MQLLKHMDYKKYVSGNKVTTVGYFIKTFEMFQ